MEIYIERLDQKAEVKPGKVSDMLESLDINPEEVLVVRNGSLVPEDARIEEGDEVKILSVISGG